MKVLLLNGSAKAKGNTNAALEEVARQLEAEGIETEIFQLGGGPVRYRKGLRLCGRSGQLVPRQGPGSGRLYLWDAGVLRPPQRQDPFLFGPGLLQRFRGLRP